MFQSSLAAPSDADRRRDLSDVDLWSISLQRSQYRRELADRQRKAAPKTKGAAAAMSAALLVSPVLAAFGSTTQARAATTGQTSDPRPQPPSVNGVIAEIGDQGGPVADVQRALGVDDDGIFGPITEDAVGDFQDRAGLPRTGVVDVATWKGVFGGAKVSVVAADSAQGKAVLASAGDDAPEQVANPTSEEAPDPDAHGGPGTPPAGVDLGTDRPGGEGQRTPDPEPDPNASPAPSGKPKATAPGPAPSAPAGECGGKLGSPVSGKVTAGFGDGRNHAGVDIPMPTGTPVHAATCGTVSEAGVQSGYGNIVCVSQSSSFSTCYAHLSKIGVSKGQYVQVGDVIGEVGSTGRSTGPHLHFETRVNGRAVDPSPYLSGATATPASADAGTVKQASYSRSTAEGGGQPPSAAEQQRRYEEALAIQRVQIAQAQAAQVAADAAQAQAAYDQAQAAQAQIRQQQAAPAPAPAPEAAPAPAPEAAAPAPAPVPEAAPAPAPEAAAPAPAPAPEAAPVPAPAPEAAVPAPAPAPEAAAPAPAPAPEAAPAPAPEAAVPAPAPAPAPQAPAPPPAPEVAAPAPEAAAPAPAPVPPPAPEAAAPAPAPAPEPAPPAAPSDGVSVQAEAPGIIPAA